MRFHVVVSLSVLVVLTASAQHREPPSPRVFRVSLDDRARMVVVRLAEEVWLGFDAQTCRVYKVWRGSVKFTGGVYDTRHGPVPQSVGETLLSSSDEAYRLRVDGKDRVISPRWRGYQVLEGDTVGLSLEVEVEGRSPMLFVLIPRYSVEGGFAFDVRAPEQGVALVLPALVEPTTQPANGGAK